MPKKEGGLDGALKFHLLSDIRKELSGAFGVLNEAGVALRGTFLVDGKGVIRHASLNDSGLGRDPLYFLDQIKAMQHVDQYGEGIKLLL